MDADRKTGLLRDAMFDPGPIYVAPDSTNNYPCTGSAYVRIRSDGSVIMGFEDGQHLTTRAGVFREPLTVLKMCLWMGGTYKVMMGWTVPFHSDMFQWPATPAQRQWIEGPVTPDLPNEAWIPIHSHIGAVWALRGMMTPDKSGYLPGALQCDVIRQINIPPTSGRPN
jgi:hypothetical protein